MTDDTTAVTKRVIEGIYDAAKKGDMAGILADFHPDMVLHEAASLPWGGTYKGVPAVVEGLSAVFAHYDLAGLVVERVFADGEWGASLIRLPRKDDPSIEMTMSEHYHVRDGKVVEAWPFYWDTAAVLETAQH